VAATAAYAGQTDVATRVDVVHNGSVVASYSSPFVACSGTSCQTAVALNSRDYGRAIKWCNGNGLVMTIHSGSSSAVPAVCLGTGGWEIDVIPALYDCSSGSCVAATNDSNVVVTVDLNTAKI
jgi:hypothetical protein